MSTEVAENKRTKDRYSPNRIEKVTKFMAFCQETFSQTDFKSSSVIKNYCEENHLSSQYLACMVSMGWVERKGDRRGAVYRWKAGPRAIQPIDARRLITCVNEVTDRYRVVITNAPGVEETPKSSENTAVVVEEKTTSVLEQPLVTEKSERKTRAKSSEKKIEVTEVTYFWGLFRKTVKKEIQ